MTPGTHLLIANIVNNYISTKLNYELEYSAFIYGNIRPDIDKKFIMCEHTFEKSIKVINNFATNLIKKSTTSQEFSMGLGVVCHFVCDYFCLPHDKIYWKKNPLVHGIYEVKLQLKLMKLLVNRSIKINYNSKLEGSIEQIVLKLKRKYIAEPEGLIRDIAYAIAASISVCEMIIKRKEEYNKAQGKARRCKIIKH